jgi:hypothetical protein
LSAGAERHERLGFLSQEFGHMFLFFGSDGAVEEADIYVFVRHGFDVFVFDVYGHWPEHYVRDFYYVQYFLVYVQNCDFASAAACSPVET